MANTLTSLLVTIMARGLPSLRKACVMPSLVRTDFSMELAKKGKTIDLPVPQALTVADVTASATPFATTNLTPTTKQITLDKWKHVSFALSDQELSQIEADATFIPMEMGEAFKALGEQVNGDLMALYKDIFGYVGTAGTTPFASTVVGATDSRKLLAQQLAPLNPRYGVLDPAAMANALALAAFSQMQNVGDAGAIREGVLGRRYGADWAEDQQIPTHTAGTLATSPLINGAVSAGATTLNLDAVSLTGTLLAGDVFTVAGDTQTYVVVTGGTAAGNALNGVVFYPPSVLGFADNAAFTLKATHVANLHFHRDAFALVVRPLADEASRLVPGLNQVTMADPLSGLPVRLEVTRQYKQTLFDIDILYGVKTLRPEYACRIAG